MNYRDIAVRNPELEEKMKSLGWKTDVIHIERDFITSDNWGQVKKQVNKDGCMKILVSPSPELMRKAVKLEELDAVLSPQRGRKDAGMNHVIAKAAAQNETSIILSFKQVTGSRKKRMHNLSHWRTIIRLSDKYGFRIVLTTEAEQENDLRNPKDLEALLRTLEAGKELITDNSEKTVEGYI